MDDFLRWLLHWRGIEPAPGDELQFEFASFPTGGLGMLVLIGIALAVLFVGFVYRRDGHNLSLWQRIVLGGLRALAVLAVVVLLLEPNVVTVKREVRPGHTILLVDTSQSMSQVDAWRRDEVQALAEGWREIGVEAPGTVTRLDLVKALLDWHDGALVAGLAAKNRVQLYGFAGGIEQLPLLPPPPPRMGPDGQPIPVDPTAPPPVPRIDLGKLGADGRSTNLGGAMRTAFDKSRPSVIAAVVFVSDGRRTAGPQAVEIARLLNQRKIPHTYVLGVGDPSETQTVSLTRVEVPTKVFQKDPFEIKATVASQGYDGVAVTARVVRVSESGAEEVVRSQQVQIGEKQEADVLWSDLTSDAPGRFLYRVEIQPPEGEPAVAERHSRTAPVEVLGDRLRLLLLAGGASHEFQILRQFLIRDKTIDVSCWIQSADEKFPQDGDEEVRIDRLPEERIEFDPYDVVIAIDPDPAKLTPRFCEHLAQHIVEDGCGFWWVAGEKFTLEALRATARTRQLADMLPIVPDVEFAERNMIGYGKAFVRPWQYVLSPDGESGVGSKVMRVAAGKDESRLLWDRLPGFHFWFPITRLKPIAVALAEHPSPEFRRGDRGMPVIALQHVGAGRVLFSASDETYRWRSIHEDAYNRFWVNGVRYLFEGRLQAGNSRLRILASDDKVDLGDPVELLAEVRDEVLQPWIAESFSLSVEREGEPAETLTLAPVEGAPGSYSVRYRPTQLGAYRVQPLEKIGKDVEVRFQVVQAQVERPGPMDRAELAAIADAQGGELFDSPQQLLAALDRIPSASATDTYRTPHAMWDGWPTIAFVIVVLSIEWLLRKRFNLL